MTEQERKTLAEREKCLRFGGDKKPQNKLIPKIEGIHMNTNP